VYWQAKGQALAKEAVGENKALRLERDRLLHQIKALHALITARDASVKAHADLVTSGSKARSKATPTSQGSSKMAARNASVKAHAELVTCAAPLLTASAKLVVKLVVKLAVKVASGRQGACRPRDLRCGPRDCLLPLLLALLLLALLRALLVYWRHSRYSLNLDASKPLLLA